MTAVLYTPHFAQFFDDNGDPLSGGLLYTYAAGTTTAKATYTTAAGTTENTNPVVLDAYGRAVIFLDGAYNFVLKDSSGNTISNASTDNVTAFTTTGDAADAFFESFSGDGSTVAFTLSEDLGTDEKLLMVFVNDESGDVGFDIQPPSAYTVSGTTLTFGTAPASGTNNVQVWAPSRLAGAASASAAAASASASEASTYATAAQTGTGFLYTYSDTVTEADPTSGYFRLNNATVADATEIYISETSASGQAAGPWIATWDDSTSTVGGSLRLTKQGSPANFAVFNVTGSVTDSGTWDKFTIAYVTGGGSWSDEDDIAVEFIRNGDKGDQGDQGPSGNIDNIATQTEAVIAADDIIIFSDTSDSAASKRDTVQGVLDLAVNGVINAIGSIGGGTQDIDLDDGRTVTATVDTSETTFTFSNPFTNDAFDLILTNGGSQTVNWPASVDWAGGSAPSLTSSGVDHLLFTTADGGTTWFGYVAGLDFS